jgi:hypothetical protein
MNKRLSEGKDDNSTSAVAEALREYNSRHPEKQIGFTTAWNDWVRFKNAHPEQNPLASFSKIPPIR